MFMRNKASVLALAALIAVALSGCGGSGGSGRMTDPEPSDTAIADVFERAAMARPAAGNVTQSSNVDSNGVTIDQVEASAGYDDNNQLRFSVQNGAQWSIGMGEGEFDQATDFPSPWKGGELETSTDAGDISVILYSDIDNNSDADYLVGGFWLFTPTDVTDSAGYAGGAFADGSDPFRQEGIMALQGTASYSGYAAGVFTSKPPVNTEVATDIFQATVTLTADFGDDNGPGMINGSITGAQLDDDGELEGTLNLGAATIGSNNSGFFQGQTSGVVEGLALEGSWGGQFFGNGASGDNPGSVAGTFSGHTTDNTLSFVGAFGAHQQ